MRDAVRKRNLLTGFVGLRRSAAPQESRKNRSRTGCLGGHEVHLNCGFYPPAAAATAPEHECAGAGGCWAMVL